MHGIIGQNPLNCSELRKRHFRHTLMGRTGLGMSVWNSPDIEGLDLRVNKLATGLDEAIKTQGKMNKYIKSNHHYYLKYIFKLPVI